ncbi:MAG: hypothetical protein M1839_002394 [Geoglossum umbratile]|nr:MAG: hypothetical protein M1839_002394 [Geoglossum umbratile]
MARLSSLCIYILIANAIVCSGDVGVGSAVSIITTTTSEPSATETRQVFGGTLDPHTTPTFTDTPTSTPIGPTVFATSTPPPIPVTSPSKPHKSSNTAAIAGGVIGGLGGLILIALAVFFIRRRRLSKRDDNNYGKVPSDLVYRTTDMSSDSSPTTYQTQYGQLPKATDPAHTDYSHPPVSRAPAERHSTSREAAKVILPPNAVPLGQSASPVSPTNELDSREVNEDGVSVRSPSPDIIIDGRFDSIRGPTPTPESQATRGRVPRLPLISRANAHDPTV